MTKRYAYARGLALLALSALVAGCFEMDIPPAGSYSEVVLVSEGGAQDPFARALLPVLTREIDYVVGKDPQFSVRHERATVLPEVPLVKNIVICGVAEPLTDIGRFISTNLGASTLERVQSGEANLFKKENLPGPGQLTVIVTAGSAGELERVIEARGEEVPGIIEQSCRMRLRKHLLKRKNQQLMDRLAQTYGIHIQIPSLYRLFSEESDPPGLEIMRNAPSRSLGIFWLDWKDPPTLEDAQALFDYRNYYVGVRYDGDTMDSTRVHFSEARLGEHPAIKMEGYWSNSTSVAGGYYETYFVHDDPGDLLWGIDLLVYAPGMPKHPNFRELLALAETFRYE